jgi:hypothetical protein
VRTHIEEDDERCTEDPSTLQEVSDDVNERCLDVDVLVVDVAAASAVRVAVLVESQTHAETSSHSIHKGEYFKNIPGVSK